ncbi:hypothetical protein JCM33374_g6576 [Metschnikowia sp. JCM 33374]|nr:hypothetical protein JCM33374_g6576 [Metschnikowia sp. JCM 33374]
MMAVLKSKGLVTNGDFPDDIIDSNIDDERGDFKECDENNVVVIPLDGDRCRNDKDNKDEEDEGSEDELLANLLEC